MAGTGAVYAVENHPQKAQILQKMVDGIPLRSIARGLVPPVSVMALQRYKANVVKPIIAKATPKTIPSPRPVPAIENAVTVQTVTQAVHDAPVVSIFRQRLEKLHGRVDRLLDKAEEAIKVMPDEDGVLCAVGKDLGVAAPLLAQAHKNLEILGRATGELEPQGSGAVSVQIVCPWVGSDPAQMP